MLMGEQPNLEGARQTASRLRAEIEALPLKNTPNVRAIRRRYSRELKSALRSSFSMWPGG